MAYIVERVEKTPLLELTDPTIEGIHKEYSERGIICRFNGLWPNSIDLYKWIHSTWTYECEISLFSKGFFMVFFHHLEDH